MKIETWQDTIIATVFYTIFNAISFHFFLAVFALMLNQLDFHE